MIPNFPIMFRVRTRGWRLVPSSEKARIFPQIIGNTITTWKIWILALTDDVTGFRVDLSVDVVRYKECDSKSHSSDDMKRHKRPPASEPVDNNISHLMMSALELRHANSLTSAGRKYRKYKQESRRDHWGRSWGIDLRPAQTCSETVHNKQDCSPS